MVLFEKSFHPETDIEDILTFAVDSEMIKSGEYVETVTKTAAENLSAIDADIEKNLKGWTRARISKVSLALLRLAICEMKYTQGMPAGVAINEAVELCKKYSGTEDASFINGVLGTIARTAENGESEDK